MLRQKKKKITQISFLCLCFISQSNDLQSRRKKSFIDTESACSWFGDLEATAASLRRSRCLFESKKERKREENTLDMYHVLHKSACINKTPPQLLLLHLKSVRSAQIPSVKLRSGSISWHHRRKKTYGRIMWCSMQLHAVQSIFKIEQDPDVVLANHQHCTDERAGKDSWTFSY